MRDTLSILVGALLALGPIANDQAAETAPTFHYWHIWTDSHGGTHQTRCALQDFDLKSMSPPASPQWQDRLRADGATVIVTVQPVGWQGSWHEDPKPKWIIPLEPAVLMVIQLKDQPTINEPCHFK